MNVLRGRFNRDNYLNRLNVLDLLIFEVIYKIIGTYTIFPLFYQFTIRSIRGVGGNLNYTNIFIPKEYNYIILFLLFLLTALYFLYEISVLVKGFSYARRSFRVGFFSLLKEGAKTTIRYLKPVNWIAILLVFVFLPVMHYGIRLAIPQLLYLMELLSSVFNISFNQVSVIAFVLLFLTYLGMIFLSYTYILFIECDVNFIASFFLSLEALSKQFVKTVAKITVTLLKILIAGALSFIVILLIGLLSYSVMVLFSQSEPQALLFRSFITYMIPLFILFGLLFSVLSTFYFFLSVYEQLYGSISTPVRSKNAKALLLVLTLICIVFAIIEGSFIAGGIRDEYLLVAQNGSIVTGHRGNMKLETDNTKASFDSALANGADYVELDVFRTLDGELVVSHDNNLLRQTGVDITITQSNYNQIKDLEFSDATRRTSPGQKILTLEEAIEYLRGRGRLMIELKSIGQNPEFVQDVLETVENSGISNRCYLISSNYDYISQIESMNKNINTLYIISDEIVDLDNFVGDGLCIQENYVTPEVLDEAHERGMLISAWPLESSEALEKMIDLGVDNLITNDVGLGQSLVINNKPTITKQLENIYSVIFRKL